MSAPYSFNKITFSYDSIEVASGFFYQTNDLVDSYPVGRYPFVYYGNKERYKVSDDSLFIYSAPYGMWSSFKIDCTKEVESLVVLFPLPGHEYERYLPLEIQRRSGRVYPLRQGKDKRHRGERINNGNPGN